MKKILSLFLCVVLCFCFSACGSDVGSGTTDSNTDNKTTVSDNILLLEQENVKISYCGISPDIGIGEGIYLLVENSRTESIIVQIAEVSLNDTMQAVIQPQMPLHLTSPDKQSKNAYVFTNVANLEGQAQFKIVVRDEGFKEIFTSDFVEISF